MSYSQQMKDINLTYPSNFAPSNL